MMHFKSLILCSGLFLTGLNALATDSGNLTDTLREVVVTGTPVQMSRNDVPQSVSVLTREEIASSGQASVLPILNGRIPGLFITERGVIGFGVSNGAAGQISLRGVGGSPTTGVLVMLDGNPQYMGIFGHPLADLYASSGVERVEVIRGPASMLYGSNAMGGVINILSRRTGKEGFSGELAARYGSFNTSELVFTGNYRHDKWNLVTTLNRNQTDGHRANSGFSQSSGYFKLGYRANEHFRLHTDLNLSRFKATDPGPDTLGAARGLDMDILRGSWSLALDHLFNRSSGSMRLYRNFGTHDLSNGFHSTDFNNGLILSERFRPVRNLLLQIGLDGNQYGGKAVATPPGVVLTDTSLMELGVNGFAQYVLAEKWTLNGGLRLQYNSQYGKEYLPTAGLAWDLGRGSTWKVSLGKGFRSPTLRELFLFNHNPALLPERVWNYETSLIQELPVGKTRLELTAFYLQGSNLILTGPMGRLYNGGKIENKGLELAASCEPMQGLQLRGTLSYIDMATPVYATPRAHAFVQGLYKLGKARFHTDLRWVEHLNTAVVGQSFQTYLLWNAGFQYNLLSNLEFSLSGNNLLNRTYETIRYYTMPGINGSAGLCYHF